MQRQAFRMTFFPMGTPASLRILTMLKTCSCTSCSRCKRMGACRPRIVKGLILSCASADSCRLEYPAIKITRSSFFCPFMDMFLLLLSDCVKAHALVYDLTHPPSKWL